MVNRKGSFSKRRIRSQMGTGLAEAAGAAIILIPIALGMLDLIFVVLSNSINDTACKNAARAAANQTSQSLALLAAQKALDSFSSSQIVTKPELMSLDIPATNDSVTCKTKLVVTLPVPVPGCSTVTFFAQDIEPIVVKYQ